MSYVRSVDTVLTRDLIYPTSVLRRSILVCLICEILGRYHLLLFTDYLPPATLFG